MTNTVELSKEQLETSACTHTEQATVVSAPSEQVCPECVAAGDTWVHLRLCLSCGHVGCCDSSKNKHATAHFNSSGHPIIRSAEPGETWAYCYVDKATL